MARKAYELKAENIETGETRTAHVRTDTWDGMTLNERIGELQEAFICWCSRNGLVADEWDYDVVSSWYV